MVPNFPKLICQDQYATTVQSTHVKTYIKYAKIINLIIVLHIIKVHDLQLLTSFLY